jgi:signal transduction histidine kinase
VNCRDNELASPLAQDRSEVPAASSLETNGATSPRQATWFVLCFVVVALSFAADLLLPRGATAAIGYCLVPFLARTSGRVWTLLSLTIVCTALTWVGYFFEPAGGYWWASAFDRAMVTGVLWLTLLLVWRRMQAEIALANKARALRAAVGELRRSNTELEEFSSVIAHDIRGPLCSISMAAKILSSRDAVKTDSECRDWIDSIVAEISQVNTLIERLLSYARIGAGKVKLISCDCESVLHYVRQALRMQMEEAEAQLTSDPLPTLHADPSLMAELLQNLIENSIKYRGSSPPRIHLSATATAEGWRLSVRDSGVGMTPEQCTHIFDRFYQGAAGSNGVGIGLATCKRIVERHGGRIEVQSEPGRGATFSFVIPDSK